ncbi:MAG: GNAT family N-acetyltransferase, partial [Bacteroidota bacterium]
LSQSKDQLADNWIRLQFGRYTAFGLGHLGAEEKDSHTFIGLGGIIPRQLKGKQEYEIAYSLLPAHWGKGYGTEIAQTMRDFGFHHMSSDRFISIIDKENARSQKVARKNGMKILFDTIYNDRAVDIYGIHSADSQR